MFNRGFIASFSTFFGDHDGTVRASGIYRGQGLSFAFLRIVFGFTRAFRIVSLVVFAVDFAILDSPFGTARRIYLD